MAYRLAHDGVPTPPRQWSRWWRTARNALAFLTGLVAGGAIAYEMETSAWQARLFANYASRLSFELHGGRSDQIAFPTGGPFDERRGYSAIPRFVDRLQDRGYVVTEQVRMSDELRRLIGLGVAAPYPEPGVAGLVVRGQSGKTLYDAQRRERIFFDYAEIPRLMVDTLLFIENRELLAAQDPRSNPTLEWDRMAKASLLYAGSKMGLPLSVEGGSTLATQLEKFRHSPRGRTSSAQDKLRQITAASLKAYRDGLDTTQRRREIIVEYLNTMPLAATPGFGEVHGVGEGLEAWFGFGLREVANTLRDEHAPAELRAQHYAQVLALLAALPAPSTLLARDREALRFRMLAYTSLMERQGILDPDLAARIPDIPLNFLPRAPAPPVHDFVDRKAATAVRKRLLELTGVDSHYELNQLHLEVDSGIDIDLQDKVIALFRQLADKDFVAANGLTGKNLLQRSDPSKVFYGLLLFERGDEGNLIRVQVDTLDQPFDLNRGAKVELGSTAKLRALAHYLEVIALLHGELSPLDGATLRIRSRAARDPLTAWVADTLTASPQIELSALLDRALDRKYAASTGEAFFTGGGLRYFVNFDRTRVGYPTLRVALQQSINLSFVRLMRDLVRYHESHLPYDTQLLLEDPDYPERLRMLTDIAEAESLAAMSRAYKEYSGMSEVELIDSVLRNERRPEKRLRKLTILHYAWYPGADRNSLARWLREQLGDVSDAEVARMVRAYGNPSLNLADYGYLASRHSLDLWCAGQLWRKPSLSWEELLESADEAREISSRWLFKRRNLRPQNRRLRVRVEKDAFARMTPYWQRLGFPFARLVPSYATALGSSGDRPSALANLLGIIVNDGRALSSITVQELRFARGTPFETTLRPRGDAGKQVMEPEVARALRDALAGVVQHGTAGSLAGAFRDAQGVVPIGGKTGTGDNRHRTFNRWGEVKTSQALNRTASFVFFIDNRFFGVITAFVPGREAEQYQFTSGLPVRVLRLLAPAINTRIAAPPTTVVASEPPGDDLVDL